MIEADIFKALADPTRRKVFEKLAGGSLNASALRDGLEISQPAMSQHLAVLRSSKLAKVRKEGRQNFYRADPAGLAPLQGRSWDAIVDTSGYDGAHVAASARLDAGHYVFVSSCNAYPDWPDTPVGEDSPTWLEGDGYGQQKAAS